MRQSLLCLEEVLVLQELNFSTSFGKRRGYTPNSPQLPLFKPPVVFSHNFTPQNLHQVWKGFLWFHPMDFRWSNLKSFRSKRTRMMPLPCSTTQQLSCSRTGGVNTGWKRKIYAPVIQIQCSHGAVSSFFSLKSPWNIFFCMLRFFLCVCIIAVIAIIATKFHQVLRCKQSEVDLAHAEKILVGTPHQVLLRKHLPFFFFTKGYFLESQIKAIVHHNLGVFFISLPSPLGRGWPTGRPLRPSVTCWCSCHRAGCDVVHYWIVRHWDGFHGSSFPWRK